MGDYAVTKIILKVKPKFQEPLKNFIEIEKGLEDLNLPWHEYEAYYRNFWESIGISSFYYERYPFSSGSYHAYHTALGSSDDHVGSEFYIDSNNNTRFEDGFWFVEFSSKVGRHSEFTNDVVPKIADAWIGLYGDEYISHPEKLTYNSELIYSFNPTIQQIIDNFKEEYNEEPSKK